MPRQRWRDDVRDELRGMRSEFGEMRDELRGMRSEMRDEFGGMRRDLHEMRDEIKGMRGDLAREFQQNRDVLRSLKASADHSAEMTERCVETLGLVNAECRASRVALEDLSDDIRAQREGLLAVVDELRRRNGPSGTN
jgi:methyl-accepting chemotaxis protein